MSGIPLPSLFGQELDTETYFVFVIAVTILFFALLRNYVRLAARQRRWKVMRESPVLARSLGYSIPRLKLTAYVISALPAGAARNPVRVPGGLRLGCVVRVLDGGRDPRARRSSAARRASTVPSSVRRSS